MTKIKNTNLPSDSGYTQAPQAQTEAKPEDIMVFDNPPDDGDRVKINSTWDALVTAQVGGAYRQTSDNQPVFGGIGVSAEAFNNNKNYSVSAMFDTSVSGTAAEAGVKQNIPLGNNFMHPEQSL